MFGEPSLIAEYLTVKIYSTINVFFLVVSKIVRVTDKSY